MYTVMSMESCEAYNKRAAYELARSKAISSGQATVVLKAEGMFGVPPNHKWDGIKEFLIHENEPEMVALLESVFEIDQAECNQNSASREQKYVLPRNFHILFRATCCQFSFFDAGIIYGKDQATSRHSCKMILDLVSTDKVFTQKYAQIIDFIKSLNPKAFDYGILQRRNRRQ